MARPRKQPLSDQLALPARGGDKAESGKQKAETESGAPQSAIRNPQSSIPEDADYTADGEAWRCLRFPALVAELGEMSVADLPGLHATARTKTRGWTILRRLFGLRPALPRPDYPADDLRLWSREELMALWGITRQQLQAELDAVRGHWQGRRVESAPLTVPVAPAAPAGELALRDDNARLEEFGFPEIRFQSSGERDWFLRRVDSWGKVLSERMVSDLARDALMTALQIRRLEGMLQDPSACKVGSEDWRANMRVKREYSSAYQQLVEQIAKLCPWAAQVAGKVGLQGMLSEITLAMQNIAARGDTALADGIFTALEIQILCRRSQQAPDPQYRAGLVVYLNQAKSFLLDPNFQSQFSASQLKRMDAAWRNAYIAAEQAEGVRLTDLESDGPEGEYPKLAEKLKVEG